MEPRSLISGNSGKTVEVMLAQVLRSPPLRKHKQVRHEAYAEPVSFVLILFM